MKRLYAAYCRSCGQANCDPRAIGACLLILAAAYAASHTVVHASAIVHGLRIAAASVLALTAAAMLLWAMRTVMRATGQHHAPACAVPRRKTRTVPVPPAGTVPVPPAGTIPVPADTPAGYTWRIRPPAEEPAATPANTGAEEPAVIPASTGTEGWSDMAAEADSWADGKVVPVVTAGGVLIENARHE
jgi:hypothetical protein